MADSARPAVTLWQRWRQRGMALAEQKLPSLTRLRKPEAMPIVLGQRRIYTLPTAFGLGFAILLMVMLLGALNYGNNAAILLTCLLAASATASLFFAFRNLSGLVLNSLHGSEAHAGERIQVALNFDPGLRGRASLRCECADQVETFALASGHDGTVVLNLTTDRRGWWRPGRIGIATQYPLGLFQAWSWINPDRNLLVFPAAERNPPPLPFDGDAYGERQTNGGDEEYAGLRDYRPSDAPRRIAWKASARRDELLVRENEAHAGTAIILDYAQLAGLDHETRISRLTAWVLAAEAAQMPYALNLPDQQLAAALGPAQRAACLRALALLPS